VVGGLALYTMIWTPWTLALHGLCQLFGHRADYGVLQTQIALSATYSALLPPVALIQYLCGSQNKSFFAITLIILLGMFLYSLRDAVTFNYHITKTQANIALFGSLLLTVGLLGTILAGMAGFLVFTSLTSLLG